MSEVADNWGSEDKLGRKEAAEFLTSFLMKRYQLASRHGSADTFVLNIRADWGFGKSFFLQRWAKDLEANFPVVFFDAWKNDYCDDPLVGFIAEINDGLSDYFKEVPLAQKRLDQALAVGKKLIKPVSIGIAAILAKQLSGYTIDQIQSIYSIDNSNDEDDDGNEGGEEKKESEISSLIGKCADVALKEHLDTKATIELFKKRLSRLIKTLEGESNMQLPMFIFIDELDRCRPTYAIELLEAVKHFFGVPGVYFVIATNLDQLGHSIRSVYGEQFDSERYLKRFFDQEYLLPLPDNTRFTELLFSKYSLSEFGRMETIIGDGIYTEPPEQALFTILCDSFKLGLRDREQVAGALQAVLLNWPKGETIHLAYLLFLIVAKQISSSLFQMLAEKQLMDISNFTQTLKLRDNATFRTRTLGQDRYGHQPVVDECKVIELLWAYHSLHNQTCSDLWKAEYNTIRFPDKVGSVIAQDCPRNYPSSQKPVPPITDYARRVSQSGQLFVM